MSKWTKPPGTWPHSPESSLERELKNQASVIAALAWREADHSVFLPDDDLLAIDQMDLKVTSWRVEGPNPGIKIQVEQLVDNTSEFSPVSMPGKHGVEPPDNSKPDPMSRAGLPPGTEEDDYLPF